VPSAAARLGQLAGGAVTVNPAILPFLKLYPLPNGGLLGNGDTGIYSSSLGQTFTENFFTTRVDHRFSEKDNIFGTFLYDNGNLTIPDALNNAVFPNKTRRRMVAVEETHIFSQNLVNSFRVGFSRSAGDVNIAGAALNPAAADTALGSAPGRAAAIITIPGINDAVGVGGNSSFNHLQNSYQVYDDAFLTRGNHSIRFGFAYENISYKELSQRRPNGRVRFRSLSDFLQDKPRDFFALDPARSKPVDVRSSIYAGYINDSWRYSPKLNLTLGVRYETSTIPTEANDGFLAVLTPSGPLVNVKKLFTRNPTRLNFEPRVGFAYDVFGDGKTSIRSGFGIYDALPLPWIFTPKEAQGTPFNTGTTLAPTGGLPTGSFPGGIYNTINFNTAPLDVPYTEQRPKRNYIMNWNLTFQHQLMSDLTVMAAYVGSRGVHMAFGTDEINIVLPVENTPAGLRFPTPAECAVTPSLCNRLNPNASQVRGTFWDGNSFYNGLQLQLNKRLSRGFQAQASYTYSKCVDDGSEASRGDQFLNGITSPLFIEKAHRRGRCAYDLRHVFVGNALWNIPGPKDGFASALLGNWQLGGIISRSSGVPFTVIISGDPLGLKGTDVVGFPDYTPGCKIENPSDPLHYIN
ncbi:MAG: TonB-dependent receptor, partial [Acidobacteriota bacterium]